MADDRGDSTASDRSSAGRRLGQGRSRYINPSSHPLKPETQPAIPDAGRDGVGLDSPTATTGHSPTREPALENRCQCLEPRPTQAGPLDTGMSGYHDKAAAHMA